MPHCIQILKTYTKSKHELGSAVTDHKGTSAKERDQQRSILLVEDEALIALAEAQMLKRSGFKVKTVLNGKDAVREGSDDKTDLILMDIDLGTNEMDGTEAARRILAKRDVPVVFLTSHSEKEYVDRVKGITQYGYVLKNDGEFVLRQAIEQAFKLFENR